MYSSWCYAQADSTQLDVITIAETRIKKVNVGSKEEHIDLSEDQYTHLEDIGSDIGMYLKSNGPNQLITPTIRGGSAAHTLLLWEGLPVSSPMLGQLNYSLIPLSLFDEVDVYKGGNSTLWGSGAVSSAINLKHAVIKDDGLTIGIDMGSLGLLHQDVSYSIKGKVVSSKTTFDHYYSKNDFKYTAGEQTLRLQNAVSERLNISQNLEYKISNTTSLNYRFWCQNASTQIPATTVQSRSESYQDDEAFRSLLSFNHLTKDFRTKVTFGYFDEYIDYYPRRDVRAFESGFRSFLTDILMEKIIGNQRIQVGINNYLTEARANGYENNAKENQLSVMTSWQQRFRHLNIQIANRIQAIDQNVDWINPSFGISWEAAETYRFGAKISRNYRFPTLNDRFWVPGGNPELKPEQGWSQELNMAYSGAITFDVSLYSRMVHDWILWAPSPIEDFWTASNINKVWSRGVEIGTKVSYDMHSVDLDLIARYEYVRSSYMEDYDLPKIRKGDQLPYVPIHKVLTGLNVDLSKVFLRYRHQWIASSKGINEDVPAYDIGDVTLGYNPNIDGIKELYIRVDNLWDANYKTVERRPMPGRLYNIGLQLKF